MILLQANQITKHFGPEPVLQGVTFDIRPGEKIGLVGPNGTGKSTLLNILTGAIEADAGGVQLHGSSTCGYLEQQPEFADGVTVWKEAESALSDLKKLAAESEQLAHQIGIETDPQKREKISERFDTVQHQIQQRDAFHLNHRIERVLAGLGFGPSSYEQQVSKLSGGQQNRLLLAKLLLESPDLMLLDEPSNHLDIDATRWLEEFLASSQQTLLVVSHDRYFLDKVTNRTLELFHGTVDSYKGNFSAYMRQKDERLEVERKTYQNQQEEIEKLEEFIRKHHHGQKHAQAEDRRKKLERIVPVDPPREISVFPMGFPSASRAGDIVLRVEGLEKSFTARLFSNVTFEIQRGERWGIIGANGTGKTTLLRCILDQLSPDAGNVIMGHGTRIGYFDQMLTGLDPESQLVDAIRPSHKEFVEQERRDMLARFGVTGDMAFQKVGSLSGGERNRVALARLAASDPNFMVLDEPTNHLDLWARATLENCLKEFDGTVLFVSHDRYFLNQVADRLLILENEQCEVIHGNYDTYLHLLEKGLVSKHRFAESDAGQKKKAKVERKKNEPKRKRKFPYRKTEEIESDIMDLENQLEELHHQLTLPEVLRDGERVKSVQSELDSTKEALSQLYEHWEEASELN